MSSSNCCFLTCIQVSQDRGQVLWYSHLFQNFPQFILIHTVKVSGLENSKSIRSQRVGYSWATFTFTCKAEQNKILHCILKVVYYIVYLNLLRLDLTVLTTAFLHKGNYVRWWMCELTDFSNHLNIYIYIIPSHCISYNFLFMTCTVIGGAGRNFNNEKGRQIHQRVR